MRSRKIKILVYAAAIIGIIGLAAGIYGYGLYQKIMSPNVIAAQPVSIYVRPGDDLAAVMQQINAKKIMRDNDDFEWWANRQHLSQHLHPGRYVLKNGMSNRETVNLLMSGRQTPVDVTFNNIRTKLDFAGRIGEQIMADSVSVLHCIDSIGNSGMAGITEDNVMTLFIPNTYELYWTTSAKAFVSRMIKEHNDFWNASRLNKAEQIGLTPPQVYIVASIVYSENAQHAEEAARIAGVYMNRINKNMKLEADPTVVYAIGDFTKKRVYLSDLEISSPYNTYLNFGLPPGPIHMPPIAYIDAVLNYEHHDYIFMCARGDGTGLHYFAKTLTEHNRNRDLYIKALNAQGIR